MNDRDLQSIIEKYLNGTASSEEVSHLHQWYESNIRPVSESTGTEEAVRKRIMAGIKNTLRPAIPLPFYRRKSLRLAMSVAAVFVFCSALILLIPFSRKHDVTVVAPAGRVTELVLPDGSKVWLNAGTSLKYPGQFKDDRTVELLGEAFFEVRKDPDHVFSVVTKGITTKVLGTAFNVKSYGNEGKTTVHVSRGRVEVTNADLTLGILKPNDQITFDYATRKASLVKRTGHLIPAWKEGKFDFNAEPFSEIAGTLSRWYQVEINFSQAQLANCRYTASFDTRLPLTQILDLLCAVNDLHYAMDEKSNRVQVKGKGCN